MVINEIKKMVESLSKADRKAFEPFEALIYSIGMEMSKGKKMSYEQVERRCEPLLDKMNGNLKYIALQFIDVLLNSRK